MGQGGVTTGAIRGCPCCLAEGSRPLGAANGFDMRACLDCGAIFTAFLPEGTAGHDYDLYYDERNLDVPAFVHERVDELVRRLASHRLLNRWLDVGFGAGALLQAAARAGWDVQGTEVAAPAIDAARARGFDVHRGDLGNAPYDPDSFDVVTMIEVIEHVPQLDELLGEAFRILRPGGALYLTTPHGRGLSARLLGVRWSVVSPPEHVQLASVRGIRAALARAGFAERSVDTHGVNPYELLRRVPSSVDGRFRGNVRVATSCGLNERLSRSAWRRAVKAGVNRLLDTTRLGDKLKCEAVKPAA